MRGDDPFRNNPLLNGDASGKAVRRRFPWAISIALHVLLLIGFLVLPARFARDEPDSAPIDIVFYKPDVERPPVLPPVVDVVDSVVEPEPEPVAVAVVESAPDPHPPEPPPVPIVARNEAPPRPKPAPIPTPQQPPIVKKKREITRALPEPERREARRPVVAAQPRNSGFGEPAREAPTAPRPDRAVTQVAFGESGETPAEPAPRPGRAVAAGSFGGGAVELPRERERRTVVAAGAFGTAPAEPEPDPAPRRAVVANTAFGEAEAEAQPAAKARSVNEGGFGAVENTPASSRKRSLPGQAPDTPVEIVSKPTPAYSDEARTLRIEGEVVLEVTFGTSGELQVLRVLDGLGHGLDEAAIEAAKKIQFTPARRDGRPVDHTATLRVVFRLA